MTGARDGSNAAREGSPAAREPSTAARYALKLLASLGVDATIVDAVDEHPAIGWARSGLMALTGRAEGPAQMCPLPLTACADGALAALASIAPENALAQLRGSDLLAERAMCSQFTRKGAVSPGGGCYLLDTIDGAIALSLARDDDWPLVPAWLELEIEPTWDAIRRVAATRTMHVLVERGRLVGLAIAPSVPVGRTPVRWLGHAWRDSPAAPSLERVATDAAMPSKASRERATPLVVDLSSLWAGPLCSRLLRLCGARVVKVESAQRPDGARRGPPEFFRRMNEGKEHLSLDFSARDGVEQLRALIASADIVIEGSRPRALRQLGIDGAEMVAANPRLTWISITGYGRGEPQEQWIAYGDDAAVGAGLSYVMRQVTGERLICGDAIADPLTGLHAALAAWRSHRAGGGGLISLAMVDVVRHCAQFDLPESADALRARHREWSALAGARPARS